ncbi:hypothetical protein VTL71DRAFT_1216 [Oculimacula yallundae]|uniref:Uncharacterized protein n=1 Tax=Oculimacula yallundae TaxID=86028 RepID=A0ABR4CAV3_9HELO
MWTEADILRVSVISLCHLTVLQLASNTSTIIEWLMIGSCWILIGILSHPEGKIKDTDAKSLDIIERPNRISWAASSADEWETEVESSQEDVSKSTDSTGEDSISHPESSIAVSDSGRRGRSPPEYEALSPKLAHLNEQKDDLTIELAQSCLVIHSQSETKRAAMKAFFGGMRGEDDGGVKERAYLKARDLYSDVLRMHVRKEGELKELEREMEEERRASGGTLVESSDGLAIEGWVA